MICPSCQSENTQTIKMVLLSGTSTTNGKIVGVDSSGDVGVAGMSSNSKTNLAASLDPGPAPSDNSGAGYFGCGGFMALFGILALVTAGGEAAGCGGGALLAGFILVVVGIVTSEKRAENLKEKMDLWNTRKNMADNGWICHKCGNIWLPD